MKRWITIQINDAVSTTGKLGSSDFPKKTLRQILLDCRVNIPGITTDSGYVINQEPHSVEIAGGIENYNPGSKSYWAMDTSRNHLKVINPKDYDAVHWAMYQAFAQYSKNGNFHEANIPIPKEEFRQAA